MADLDDENDEMIDEPSLEDVVDKLDDVVSRLDDMGDKLGGVDTEIHELKAKVEDGLDELKEDLESLCQGTLRAGMHYTRGMHRLGVVAGGLTAAALLSIGFTLRPDLYQFGADPFDSPGSAFLVRVLAVAAGIWLLFTAVGWALAGFRAGEPPVVTHSEKVTTEPPSADAHRRFHDTMTRIGLAFDCPFCKGDDKRADE